MAIEQQVKNVTAVTSTTSSPTSVTTASFDQDSAPSSMLCSSAEILAASLTAVLTLRIKKNQRDARRVASSGDITENIYEGANNDEERAAYGFHSSTMPPISLSKYLNRLVDYLLCSRACFIMAVKYLERFVGKTKLVLTKYNVFRLLVVAVVLAAKVHDDKFYTNFYYARVAGIGMDELNKLEVVFCKVLGFELFVRMDEFWDMERALIAEVWDGKDEEGVCKDARKVLVEEGLNRLTGRHNRNNEEEENEGTTSERAQVEIQEKVGAGAQ